MRQIDAITFDGLVVGIGHAHPSLVQRANNDSSRRLHAYRAFHQARPQIVRSVTAQSVDLYETSGGVNEGVNEGVSEGVNALQVHIRQRPESLGVQRLVAVGA
jgi:hypothetical protein